MEYFNCANRLLRYSNRYLKEFKIVQTLDLDRENRELANIRQIKKEVGRLKEGFSFDDAAFYSLERYISGKTVLSSPKLAHRNVFLPKNKNNDDDVKEVIKADHVHGFSPHNCRLYTIYSWKCLVS